MNFGSNAIKYGKPGGHVTLSAALHLDGVRLSVSDDGIGIADANRALVFEPFQRAGQETGPIEGTGIGLTISRRLASLMRGSIDFTSTVGTGSTFWIDLPLHLTASAPHPTTPSHLAASPLATGPARHRVLYIEDNPSSAALMRDLVDQLAALELVISPTAEAGLAEIAVRRPALVIMDINLPGMSGFQATEHLRASEATRTLPIIGLSAAALPTDTSRAARTGFDRYLTKPLNLPALTRALEDLLVG
jgi:CheY-like chemotaxis protein